MNIKIGWRNFVSPNFYSQNLGKRGASITNNHLIIVWPQELLIGIPPLLFIPVI